MFNSIRRAIRLSRERSREDNAQPFSRQLWEMARLQLTTKLGPGNYHKYRLWQKDIPWEEKKGYWHDQKYYEFLNRVNPYKYRIVARHKVLAKALLQFYGIADADYHGYLSQSGGFSATGQPVKSAKDLESLLAGKPELSKVCFKLVEGSEGIGFFAVEISRDNGILLNKLGDSQTFSVADFLDKELKLPLGNEYIIESYLEQHPDLAQFNPSSLNTMRAWVTRTASGEVDVVGVYLRVGRSGKLVDNVSSGGFVVTMDNDSFKTGFGILKNQDGAATDSHPDSGFKLAGVQVPFKQETLKLCKDVISILPSTQFVGLDIAFTPHGPAIVEFNLAPSPQGAGSLLKSHKELFADLL
ncbi:sugar-transfer associated ATP-grasp domain-containing protein [Lacimicrobium alkaliphilum]|uniref:Alpha-L-glutamate ligase-related protein ATP-grasp domain-containing protein n=1 Tax=Lacimicrobium alkaliphilum TaxID=1526571 RepID=A0A0U3A9H9_9ALTE|nr:sugar-transfer associated ATP-grasp domain-containing protein [Lacimicrobium alkaliphilum]ALS97662.1 hypothetical protein AT746_04835 [Lacimicrobium alkaliphilum]